MNLWIDAGIPLYILLSDDDEERMNSGQPIDISKYSAQIKNQLTRTIKEHSSNQAKRIARNLLESL